MAVVVVVALAVVIGWVVEGDAMGEEGRRIGGGGRESSTLSYVI